MNIVITNNPLVRDKLSCGGCFSGHTLEFHDTDYFGVLKAVRDKIHLGCRLLTHPLSGSVKPGETPYKTVIVTGEREAREKNAFSFDENICSSSIDEKALSIIEESIQAYEKMMPTARKNEFSEKMLADFQLIDYSLIFG